MFWAEENETLDRDSLSRLQLDRLQALLARVTRDVPYYRQKLSGIAPEEVSSLAVLSELPFTTKDTLREHYPFGLLAVPLERVVRIHASSGTTGKQTVVVYTRADMALWGEVMARTLVSGGVTSDDVVHNAYGYGLFTGGLGFGLGAETVGAATVPASSGQTSRHLKLLEDFGATVLCCTPSYALVLAETAEQEGIDLRARLKLRVGFFGAEPWSQSIREEVETRLSVEAFDVYGLSEIIGPGVAVDCGEHQGLHINEDHFLPEVIDPETGAVLPTGRVGELVFTTLTKEALPLIRYRTRDRVRLTREPCACGRAFARMSKVQGRTDDMLIVRGVNVFPSQIEEALLGVPGIAPQYAILVDRGKDHLDDLEVWVEPTAESDRGDFSLRERARLAQERVESILGIRARVRLVNRGEIERSQGKAVRVIDRREGS
ncbi:MAG: phenylacetate--CoA ligase family protein [Vicinamibacteria bacterium]